MKTIIRLFLLWILAGFVMEAIHFLRAESPNVAIQELGWAITIMVVILAFFTGRSLWEKGTRIDSMGAMMSGLASTVTLFIVAVSTDEDITIAVWWVGILFTGLLVIYAKEKFLGITLIVGWSLGIYLLCRLDWLLIIIGGALSLGVISGFRKWTWKPKTLKGLFIGITIGTFGTMFLISLMMHIPWPIKIPLPIDIGLGPTLWLLVASGAIVGAQIGWQPKLLE